MCLELNVRKYTPLWNALKSSLDSPASQAKGVSIRANPGAHKQIRRELTKEKHRDVGWKLKIAPQYTILTHSINGNVMTFWLTKYPIPMSEKLGLD